MNKLLATALLIAAISPAHAYALSDSDKKFGDAIMQTANDRCYKPKMGRSVYTDMMTITGKKKRLMEEGERWKEMFLDEEWGEEFDMLTKKIEKDGTALKSFYANHITVWDGCLEELCTEIFMEQGYYDSDMDKIIKACQID